MTNEGRKEISLVSAFNPDMLTLARELRGYSQAELSQKIGVTQSLLSKIEKGLRSASDEVVRLLSVGLDVPATFFFRKGQMFKPNLYYRKKSKASAKSIMKTEADMNLHRLSIQELLDSIAINTNPISPMDVEEHGSPIIIAKKLRQFWRVPRGPINNLFELIERNGIIIVLSDIDSVDVSGRSMETDESQPIIFLNNSKPMDHLRFTLAHELFHIISHIPFSVAIAEGRDIELEANQFASEFLMPEDDFRGQIVGKVDLAKLADLKRYWKTSMQAILRRFLDLRIISPNHYKSLMIQISSLDWRMREPSELDPPKEKPILLSKLIEMHISELEYSEDELSEMLRLNVNEFRNRYLNEDKNKLKLVYK